MIWNQRKTDTTTVKREGKQIKNNACLVRGREWSNITSSLHVPYIRVGTADQIRYLVGPRSRLRVLKTARGRTLSCSAISWPDRQAAARSRAGSPEDSTRGDSRRNSTCSTPTRVGVPAGPPPGRRPRARRRGLTAFPLAKLFCRLERGFPLCHWVRLSRSFQTPRVVIRTCGFHAARRLTESPAGGRRRPACAKPAGRWGVAWSGGRWGARATAARAPGGMRRSFRPPCRCRGRAVIASLRDDSRVITNISPIPLLTILENYSLIEAYLKIAIRIRLLSMHIF